MASDRILILSSQTGGGHQSAAMALQDSLLRLSAGRVMVTISQVLEEAHFLTHRLADLYNYLLRYHQHYMKYYYGTIQALRPYQSNLVFQLSWRYGCQLIQKLAPTKLVSVHPMTQHFFAHLLKKLNLQDKIPLITVVTDPCKGFWNGWACDDVSQYYVASEDAQAQLIEYGIPASRIQIAGIPIHNRFQPVTSFGDKQALREYLQLDQNRFTVLVNAGWVGGGNVPQLYEALLQSNLEALQVVFLSGHNTDLQHHATQLAEQARFPVKVIGYTTAIEQYMNASDTMISKLGGLTTFEAMACQLPILADCLTPPMPQEKGTANWLQQCGAGALITQPQDVIAQLHHMLSEPQYYNDMRAAAQKIGRPGSADYIAGRILTPA